MPDDSPKLREIRAKLDAIAPMPEGETVTARDLGLFFAVRAQERFTRMLHPAGEVDPAQVATMGAEFAAAHALFTLAEADGNIAPEDESSSSFTAAQIRDAIEDGGGIGEWLFEHLGRDTADDVAALAGEMADAVASEPQRTLPQILADLRSHADEAEAAVPNDPGHERDQILFVAGMRRAIDLIEHGDQPAQAQGQVTSGA